jgi:hypothetical protein
MADTYDVYFGEAMNMSLVSEAQANSFYSIPPKSIEYGILYEWRIDATNEYGTTLGTVWDFTGVPFLTPTDISAVKRLIAAADGKIYYEDI